MTIELDHVVLEVEDPAAAARWFEARLGLAPVRLAEFTAGSVPFTSVRVGPGTIIDLFPRRMWRSAQAHNPNHLCFTVDPPAFEAFRASLAPGEIVRTDDHNFGARGYGSSIYIEGPDGMSIEVRAYLR